MPASLVAATFRSGLRLDPFRWARLGFARSHDWVCSGGLNRAYEAQVRVYAKLTATLRFREHEPAFGTRIATGLKLSGCADESCLGNRSHNHGVHRANDSRSPNRSHNGGFRAKQPRTCVVRTIRGGRFVRTTSECHCANDLRDAESSHQPSSREARLQACGVAETLPTCASLPQLSPETPFAYRITRQ